MHIFKNNSAVNLWNKFYLSRSEWQLREVKPSTSPYCPECESSFPHSYLGTGVPIYLTRNLIVSKRLCNGTLAVVHDLFFANDSDPLPQFVTIHADKYSGKCLSEDQSIPIAPIRETIPCPHLRTKVKVVYFPISNSHARTFYKIQSLSLDSIAVDLDSVSTSDKASVYTAFSRCRTLKGLLVHSKRSLAEFFK